MNGPDGYDCMIAVSGGKDSHFQVWLMKEVMHMNPLLVSACDNLPMKMQESTILKISLKLLDAI